MAERDGPSHVTSTTPPPRTKRYSSVNISKKFLEKNHQPPLPSNNSVSIPKPTSARAPSQTPINHSKLVAAKLTGPSPSTSTQGWPRPSSVAPQSASPPPSLSNSSQKLIHPQPRPSLPLKDGHSKLAWASLKSASPSSSTPPSADFPTAAEVAHSVSDRQAVKLDPASHSPPETPQVAESNKQREMEAAAFRGEHLDPNAHHWDEEEDDDNFLDGVLEFGDGKQYKIESAGLPDDKPQLGAASEPHPPEPIRKQDRFADDFDRSWPRSKPPPSHTHWEPPAVTHHPPPIHHPTSPSDPSRVLFNERSNKLEPYTNSRPPLKSSGSVSPTRSNHIQLFNKHGPESPPRPRGNPFFSDRRRDSSRDSVRLNRDRDFHQDTRGRRMPPPPFPQDPIRQSSAQRPTQSPVSSTLPLQSPRIPHHKSDSTHSSIAAPHVDQSENHFQEELEEARKDLMHLGAERAKQRRQREEEERLKAQERARQKGAELEEKLHMHVTTSPKVVASEPPHPIVPHIPHEVAPPAVPSQEARLTGPPQFSPPVKHAPPAPLEHLATRPTLIRKESKTAPSIPDTPAEQSASWRMKTSPIVTSLPPKPSPLPFEQPPPSALDHVIDTTDLEVVDFAESSAFFGIPDSKLETDDQPEPQDDSVPAPHVPEHPPHSPSHDERQSATHSPLSPSHGDVWRMMPTPEDANSSLSWPQATAAQRTLAAKNSLYKEGTMTSLDDTMSRIKGALDVMHDLHHPLHPKEKHNTMAETLPKTEEPHPVPSPKLSSASTIRWTPHERFLVAAARESLVTVGERPPSPKPAWHVYNVRIPKDHRFFEPVMRRQLDLAARQVPLRWDILSFDPPVEGMSKRVLSVNDVIFRQHHGHKTKPRFRVALPKSLVESPVPTVNMPTPRPTSGAFGRTSAADGLASWRKTPTTPKVDLDDAAPDMELNTTSRSPPPELRGSESKSLGFSPDLRQGARPKQAPKIPDGVGVGFYKSASDGEPGSVNFIVSSELDMPATSHGSRDGASASIIGGHLPVELGRQSVSRVFPPSNLPNGIKASPVAGEYSLPPLVASSKAESKSSQDSTDRLLLTPPNPSATWTRSSLTHAMKDSPSRVPDPEHLKAVWSQTSDIPEVPSVNSLEGIADDLTSVPFTIQDVKSEDGETPPPTAPSRISLHDVTRAFQQVPQTKSTPLRNPVSPSTTASSPIAVVKQTPLYPSNSNSNPNPQQPNPARQPYLSFSSAAPGPSNAPSNQMYSTHVPSPQVAMGNRPLYGQPLWMPMGGGNPSQTPVLRPMASTFTPGSPYGAQMMAYPGQGTPPMYQPQMSSAPPNGPQNRVPQMQMMSPILTHPPPHPMYPASPVMMSTPPMMHAAAANYVPGRPPPPRTDQGQAPPHFVPQGYPPMNSAQYARAGW